MLTGDELDLKNAAILAKGLSLLTAAIYISSFGSVSWKYLRPYIDQAREENPDDYETVILAK